VLFFDYLEHIVKMSYEQPVSYMKSMKIMTFILICDYVVVEKNAKIAEDKLRAAV
jgi:hypothetical protein